MNDFLLVLLYQSIIAVNTAVIISGIIWLTNRKAEIASENSNRPSFERR